MPTDWFFEEYKLVQEKIDKVQSNQFQVRSWSVSVLTGFVLGIFATHLPVVVLVFAIPVIWMFHVQDRRQKRFRETLSNRALQLEGTINLLGLTIENLTPRQLKRWARMRQQVHHLGPVPGLGRALAANQVEKSRWVKNADLWFWRVQYWLVIIIVGGYVLVQVAAFVLGAIRGLSVCGVTQC
jgi:hypothetical protein